MLMGMSYDLLQQIVSMSQVIFMEAQPIGPNCISTSLYLQPDAQQRHLRLTLQHSQLHPSLSACKEH